ncbi:MAG: AAA family ATPase [Candidatus Aminicenantes bacterium]|nr:AAA family ATPase [Candidatus Aminicenantes bacterium]
MKATAGPGWRIGLTGRMASGKGEAVRILKDYGFQYISLSDIVRREAAKLGPALNRGQMQDLGNRLRRDGGAGILGKMVREHIEAAQPSPWVIDGIRNPTEVAELKKMDRFFLVGIDSAVETILARMKRRKRATDAVGEAELRAALAREWGVGEPAGGQQVGPTMALADFTIANEGPLPELKIALDAVLRQIGVGHV